MKIWLWILGSCLILMACEHPLIEKEVGAYENGQVKMVKVFEQHGDKEVLIQEKQFHENGKLKMEGGYEDGERQGLWKAYFKNGQVQSELAFEKGSREGVSKVYYPTGQLMYEGQYAEDQKIGNWKFYTETGQLSEEKTY